MKTNNSIHDNIRVLRGLSPVAIGTTGTGKTSAIIDRQGYGGIEFLLAFGTITATGAVFTVTMFEGDVTGTMTSVADKDLVGTEAAAGIIATTPRTSGTSKNTTRRIGYIGNKRYVSCKVASTVTAGTLLSIDALMFNPAIVPTANP